MFTDIAGFTALNQSNESQALKILESHNRLLRPFFPKFNGREVKTIGDSFLVEFDSALDAVNCAVEIQKLLHDYNISSKDEWKIKLRIGIHLGDVVHKGNDILGDAVNIASRIEHLADPEGVCVSEQIFAQIHNKIGKQLQQIEKADLKNVSFPTKAYAVIMPWEEKTKPQRNTDQFSAELDARRIAVLPFTNISPDPNDEYFSDGMTEELISVLSQIQGLRVIARTSVNHYKKSDELLSQIAQELGVGTILEGSVRKSGDKLRISVQLIDSRSSDHLWSESYDRELKDIFAIQSDISQQVAAALKVKLLFSEKNRITKKPTDSMEAYSYYLKGKQLMNEGPAESFKRALEFFNRATDLDQKFARAYVEIGNCYAWLGSRSYLSIDDQVSGMESAARKAVEIDRNLAEGHVILSTVAQAVDDFARAEEEARMAIELNPNLAEAYEQLAEIKATVGYPKKALELHELALMLDPLSSNIINNLGLAYLWNSREKDALDFWNRNRKISPFVVARSLAEYHFGKNDLSNAKVEVALLEELSPGDPEVIWFRGALSALGGDTAGAKEAIDRLESEFRGGAVTERVVGELRYFLGDLDAFFDAMFRALKNHSLDAIWLRYSPLLQKAREDPRYHQIMRMNNLDPELKE